MGLSFDEIIRDYYPGLAVEDIQACIHYVIARYYSGCLSHGTGDERATSQGVVNSIDHVQPVFTGR
jgi:hypothetical protein